MWTYKPELFSKPLNVVRQVQFVDEQIADGRELTPADTFHPGPNNIRATVGESHAGGTSAEYLTKRIVRDHPEIAERMRNGEFKSVRAAALEAGIAPKTLSVRIDDPASEAGPLSESRRASAVSRLRLPATDLAA